MSLWYCNETILFKVSDLIHHGDRNKGGSESLSSFAQKGHGQTLSSMKQGIPVWTPYLSAGNIGFFPY